MPLHQVPPWFQTALARLDVRLAAKWDNGRWTIQHYNQRHRCWDTILHVYYRDAFGHPVKDGVRRLDRSVLAEVKARDTYRGFDAGDIPRQIERRIDHPEDLRRERGVQNDIELSTELAKTIAPAIFQKLFHSKLTAKEVERQLQGTKDLRELPESEQNRFAFLASLGMRRHHAR